MDDSSKKILIVEDEAPLSSVLKDRLSNEGFTVLEARNGEQGLELAASEKPSLILLDILLPKKGGLAMLHDLRARKDISKIPVIMLTNLSDSGSINEAKELGVNDFLVKSDTQISDIVEAIRAKLGS